MPDGAFNIVQYNTGGCAADHSGRCGGSSLVGFGGDLGAGRPAGKGGIFALRHRGIAGIDGVLRSGDQAIKGQAAGIRSLPFSITSQPVLNAVKGGNRDAVICPVGRRGCGGGRTPGRDGQARCGGAGVVEIRGRCAEINRHFVAPPANVRQGHICGALHPFAGVALAVLHARRIAGQGLALIVDGGGSWRTGPCRGGEGLDGALKGAVRSRLIDVDGVARLNFDKGAVTLRPCVGIVLAGGVVGIATWDGYALGLIVNSQYGSGGPGLDVHGQRFTGRSAVHGRRVTHLESTAGGDGKGGAAGRPAIAFGGPHLIIACRRYGFIGIIDGVAFVFTGGRVGGVDFHPSAYHWLIKTVSRVADIDSMFRRGGQTAECGAAAPAFRWYFLFVFSRIAVLHIADGTVRLGNGLDCQGRIRHLACAGGRFTNVLLKLRDNTARSRDGALDGHRSVVYNFTIHGQGHIRRDGQRLALLDGQSIALGDFQVIHDFKGIATVDFTLALGFGDNQAAPASGIIVAANAAGDNNRIAVIAGGESTANARIMFSCGRYDAAIDRDRTITSSGSTVSILSTADSCPPAVCVHDAAIDRDGTACPFKASTNTSAIKTSLTAVRGDMTAVNGNGAAACAFTAATNARAAAAAGGRYRAAVDGNVTAIAADARSVCSASSRYRAAVDGDSAACAARRTSANACAAVATGGLHHAAVDGDSAARAVSGVGSIEPYSADACYAHTSRCDQFAHTLPGGLGIDGQRITLADVDALCRI